MARGQKSCPECHKITGPRTYKCECGYEFPIKSKTPTASSEDPQKTHVAQQRVITREELDLDINAMMAKYTMETILAAMVNKTSIKWHLDPSEKNRKYEQLLDDLHIAWENWKGE